MLDSARAIALRRARFTPARDTAGRLTGGKYRIPGIRWILMDDPIDLSSGSRTDVISKVRVDVDREGKGVRCQSGTPSISDLQACGSFKPGTKVVEPLSKDGKRSRAG